MQDKSVQPFEVSEKRLIANIDSFVDTTIASLASFYLEMPRGGKFLEYEEFHKAYEAILTATRGFAILDRDAISDCIDENPRAFAVLRCILGISPPDLADMATERTGLEVQQGTARAIDQKARQGERLFTDRPDSATNLRIRAMIEAACQAIEHYPGMEPKPLLIHRLEKVDTRDGTKSLQKVAKNGVAYSALLYERLLGRPFASHRDSVSELVGDIVEAAVVKVLSEANVPFFKTRARGGDQCF